MLLFSFPELSLRLLWHGHIPNKLPFPVFSPPKACCPLCGRLDGIVTILTSWTTLYVSVSQPPQYQSRAWQDWIPTFSFMHITICLVSKSLRKASFVWICDGIVKLSGMIWHGRRSLGICLRMFVKDWCLNLCANNGEGTTAQPLQSAQFPPSLSVHVYATHNPKMGSVLNNQTSWYYRN